MFNVDGKVGQSSRTMEFFRGDLRNHRIRPDGSYRHSSYYSILDTEWPAVKRSLLERVKELDPK